MIARLRAFYDPSMDPLYLFIRDYKYEYRLTSYAIWGLAIAYTAGDIVTTWIALTPLFGGPYEPFREAIPFTRWALSTFGPWVLLPKKGLMLGFIGLVWWLFPKPYQLLFPAMTAVANYLFTVHNLALLLEYGVFHFI